MAQPNTFPDPENLEALQAWKLINETNHSVFLTGKAGTGKTTFLRNLKEKTKKKMMVVAPTGVAAINAEGVTIHSQFLIPFGPFVPDDHRLREKALPGRQKDGTIYTHFKYNSDRKKVLRKVELLVIDEVSMVRADLLDVIDKLLRTFGGNNRHRPFGGVQLLLIGDPFQLPPILKDDDRIVLEPHYRSEFFFHAHSFQELNPACIELQKVYRQKDPKFIGLLNQVRTNELDPQAMAFLNQKYQPSFEPPADGSTITLAAKNFTVDKINFQKISALEGEPFIFTGEVKGEFPKGTRPAPEKLSLKKDAQIMFVKNDSGETKSFFNGKIGRIAEVNEDSIVVVDEHEKRIKVEPVTWRNIRYVWNSEAKKIEEEEIGSYIQYPLKLAWAITVHKSQGLTFDNVFADLGNSFAAGQVYVALSRCTSYEGLMLRSVIPPSAIRTDRRVVEFARQLSTNEEVEALLRDYQVNNQYKKALKEIQKGDFDKAYPLLSQAMQQRNDLQTPTGERWFKAIGKRFQQARRQLLSLQRGHKDLEEELWDCEDELEQMQLTNKALEAKIKRLEKHKQKSQQTISQLMLDGKANRSTIRQLKKQLQRESQTARELKAELTQLKNKGFWQRLFS